ncbi:hypothetical protein [Streptomyces graminilatus]|uniref:hypothetical protein n=1 Tax=Streptomyces graminilatus TaxID=1464070 RepID=UPI000A4039C1|nr:hypothetical protein [Streptomyces graminilatus]
MSRHRLSLPDNDRTTSPGLVEGLYSNFNSPWLASGFYLKPHWLTALIALLLLGAGLGLLMTDQGGTSSDRLGIVLSAVGAFAGVVQVVFAALTYSAMRSHGRTGDSD